MTIPTGWSRRWRAVSGSDMKTVVIVQARMTSTRLPGKVLLDLAGRTVLAHVLERVAAIPGIAAVGCAGPDDPASQPLAAEAARCGAEVFLGSEQDVLDRTWAAAAHLGADVVLRVTSDCPLIDPAVCAGVLALQAAEQSGYACNNLPPSWPHGLDCEAFPFPWLERAARQATAPFDREHVGPFLRNHPEIRPANYPAPRPGLAGHRWTLDTPADLAFLRALFPRLPAGPQGFSWQAPLAAIEADPTLAAINRAHVEASRLPPLPLDAPGRDQ